MSNLINQEDMQKLSLFTLTIRLNAFVESDSVRTLVLDLFTRAQHGFPQSAAERPERHPCKMRYLKLQYDRGGRNFFYEHCAKEEGVAENY